MWTKKAPTVPGWYWLLDPTTGDTTICEIRETHPGDIVNMWVRSSWLNGRLPRLVQLGYEFQGPIVPEEAAPEPVGIRYPWADDSGVVGSALVVGKRYRVKIYDTSMTAEIFMLNGLRRMEYVDVSGGCPIAFMHHDYVFTPLEATDGK